MAKAVPRKKKVKGSVAATTNANRAPPRWRVLPPEIVSIIIKLLKGDEHTLRACSLAAREFSEVALSRIGRHVTVNRAQRIKQFAAMVTNSGFQHVRSLDLGVPGKYSNPGKTSEEQLIVLHIFAQRQTLTRLWLSKVSFPTIGSHKTIKIQDIAIALGSTVSDLGLYECLFRSYIDTISFIRAFPHCGSLYIRDCVSSAKNSSGEVFSGLPMHNLSLNALELSSSSSNGSIIDVSTLVEDAGLDVARLSALTCDVGSVAQAHSVAKATSVSPIRHFRLTSTRSGAFHAFLCPMGKEWRLESLTIGPLTHKTDDLFWHDAFLDFPAVPCLDDVTIVCYYPNANAFDTSTWDYFKTFFDRTDIFPPTMQMDLRMRIGSELPGYNQRLSLNSQLSSLRSHRLVTLNGHRYWFQMGV